LFAVASAPSSCIIVEIPAKTYGSLYGQARDQLAALVDTTHLGANGDLNPPVQVTFTGAAFFDGYHQKTTQGVGVATTLVSGHTSQCAFRSWAPCLR